MSIRQLQVAFTGMWHVGSGREDGYSLDARVLRDPQGLPFVPGRMLRGLLRDAAESLAAWGHTTPSLVETLFGSLQPRVSEPGRWVSVPGQLAVSDARLPEAERRALIQPEAKPWRAALYRQSFQTALNPQTGVAHEGSLRGTELVIPVTLLAEVQLLSAAGNSPGQTQAFWALLDDCLPLVRALGAMKTRGHGRATLSWQPQGQMLRQTQGQT